MIHDLYQYRKDLNDQGVYLSVTGNFSQILLEGIADVLKQKMSMDNVQRTAMTNVFSVVVEHVQNIFRYSAEVIPGAVVGDQDSEIRIGTLVVGKDDDNYFVLSGNLVYNSEVEALKAKLTPLLNMTKQELKDYYKEQRRKKRDGTIPKGAGLGLIEMARKSSKPLAFSFQKLDEELSFFSINTII